MKKTFITLLSLALLGGCARKEESRPATEKTKSFSSMLDRYYEEYLKRNPFEATLINDNRYNSLLPNDISESERAGMRAFYTAWQDSLRQYDKAGLSDQEQVSYTIFEYEMAEKLEMLRYPDNLLPVQQFWGTVLQMPQLGSGQSFQPFRNTKDYDDFLGRIDGFTVWVDTAIVNMRKGLVTGYTYPKILMERVLPQCKDMMVMEVTKSIFYQPITNMPDSINAEDKQRITQAYARAIQEKVVPTYTRLYNFLKDEYIPRTRTSAGIDAVPNGKEFYQALIRHWTTTDLTPDSIFRLGESEVARIQKEMEEVKTQMGFKGDLKAFFKYVNNDKKFMPFTTDQQVIDAFKAIEQKIEPKLKTMFNTVPRTRFEVRQTEAFREASAAAEYQSGAPDGSRPGIFYVPVLDAKTFNVSGMETLFLHEAIPGHHYQNSLQMENGELPRFRRTLWYGAYGEGWALYTESLGKELGLYTEPIQYFGHLGDEMHRAIRLVVDVGLHSKGWTREQAIKYMMDHEPLNEQGTVAEIERYMAIPGQALSYKIGQLKISELRHRAEQALGAKFNLGLFHDEVLKYGCLPLSVLEEKIQAWIDRSK